MIEDKFMKLPISTYRGIVAFTLLLIMGYANSSNQFPTYQQGVDFFNDKRAEFHRVANFLLDNPEIQTISAHPREGWCMAGTDGNCEGLVREDIRKAMEKINVGLVVKTHRGDVLFDSGAETLRGRSWEVSILYRPGSYVDRKECNPTGPDTEVGVCDFKIATGWYLHYEWQPADLTEMTCDQE